MNRKTRALVAVLVGAGLMVAAAPPAFSGDEFCPMGGTLIKAEVDKDKALAWGKDRRKFAIAGEDSDAWSVLTLSTSDDDIAIVVRPGSVFFGVAGRGREVESRDLEKVFGSELRNLRDAIRKEMGDLRKADVVKIEGGDVQTLSDAAGLGVLEKGRSEWALTTEKCEGTDIDVSGL